MIRRVLQRGICLGVLLAAMPVRAELVFSAPPWGTEEAQRAIFEPIAAEMSKWLGTKVTYRYNSNFTTYSLSMRGGKYDLVFDGPQFNSWRTTHLKHTVLVNLPEPLAFMTVTDNKAIKSSQDLINKPVCAQSPPQLGTLLLWSQYDDPARQPELKAIKGEPQVLEDLKAGKCSTAVLRNSAYAHMTDTEKAKYKVVYTSRTVPNLAMSASPNVTESQRRVLIEKLTDEKSAKVFQPIFTKYVKSATKFQKADPKEYDGLDLVLKKGSYGW